MRWSWIPLGFAIMLGGTGCPGPTDSSEPDQGFISPVTGQTAWPTDAPLTLFAPSLDLPPDYPLADALRVTDTTTGEQVLGRIEQSREFIQFFPQGRFREGRTFRWSVRLTDPIPHGPHYDLPEHMRETNTFTTSQALDALALDLDTELGGICLILSRRIETSDVGTWRVWVNGDRVPQVVAQLIPQESWSHDFAFPIEDPGVDVVCLDLNDPSDESFDLPISGDEVEVRWGGRGTWSATIEQIRIVDHFARLRREIP